MLWWLYPASIFRVGLAPGGGAALFWAVGLAVVAAASWAFGASSSLNSPRLAAALGVATLLSTSASASRAASSSRPGGRRRAQKVGAEEAGMAGPQGFTNENESYLTTGSPTSHALRFARGRGWRPATRGRDG